MRKSALAGAAVALLACVGAGAANAGTVVMNFDTMTVGATVDNYYNGGTDSLGETGPNYGAVFTPGDWEVSTGFGETSPPNFAYSFSGAGAVNVANGFTGSVYFTYGAFTPSTVSIYSGLNGTGTLLAQATGLDASPEAFGPETISFSGKGESIVVSSGAAQFGWDDLTLSGVAVPEPAAWALMLVGVGAIGAGLRVRRSPAGEMAS
jgi:hypothetical protein